SRDPIASSWPVAPQWEFGVKLRHADEPVDCFSPPFGTLLSDRGGEFRKGGKVGRGKIRRGTSSRPRVGPAAPGPVQTVPKRFPFRLRPRKRIGNRTHRLLRAPDQVELAIPTNPANGHRPPGVLSL